MRLTDGKLASREGASHVGDSTLSVVSKRSRAKNFLRSAEQFPYSLTVAGREVAFWGVAKPDGVFTLIRVLPLPVGMNRPKAWSDPAFTVSGDSIVPTAGSLLSKTTVAVTPKRSGWTVRSAARPVSGSI